MATIRTLSQFQDALDKEVSWRFKEIQIFQSAARESSAARKSFIRAGVALIYAHWEGFIKSASEIYLEYVKNKSLTYRELKSCFAVFGLKTKLSSLSESKKSELNIETFNFILEEMDKTADFSMKSAINTDSNLTSKVFCNIAQSLSIDTSLYSTKFNLIDESLVKRRNAIAHGEYLDLSGADFHALAQEVLILIRCYKTDLENAASLEGFMRA